VNTEWLYLSAKQLVAKLKTGEISSRALLETYIARINDKNTAINAVVAMDLNAARARADAADAAVANGENWGVLHGLPVTIKDTYEVAGMPCTVGAEELRNYVPAQAAFAVQRMIDAGAIVFAKTNVPVYASDLQSYNSVYGTSNNPWNNTLTPGGSSGGAAAALAAGFTALELGSDLAGSIRIPAHFCGVYGHKVTHGVISMRGHIPGPKGVLKEPDLAVAGPMARTADDLQLLLDVVAGASPLMATGWQLKLPAAKQKKLKDFRVLVWIDDPLCPIDQQMMALYQQLLQKLQADGVDITVGAPLGMKLDDFYPLYLKQLGSLMGLSQSKMLRRLMGVAAPLLAQVSRQVGKYVTVPTRFEHFLEGAGQSYSDWHRGHEKSLRLRQRFSAVFDQYDVILMPPAATTALKHQHRPELAQRKIQINGQQRSYTEMFMWIAPASLLGLPATSAPIGLTPQGLPVNIQILGAPYHDKTTIKFASLLADVMGGFTPPSGY
jgi:amidase